jgi:hypothetical protein
MSSRSPLYTGSRIRPSFVQESNVTSITSRGSTQTAVRAYSGGTGPANGGSARSSGLSLSPSMRSVSVVNPVPTWPA